MNTIELYQKKAAAYTAGEALLKRCEDEKRALTAEELSQWQGYVAEMDP